MRVSLVSTFLPLATLITVAYATLSTRFRPGLIALEAAKYAPVNFSGFSSFQQLIDHDDPDLGTFNQRYWFNFTYWGGPGYPVCWRSATGNMDISDSWTGRLIHSWRNGC